jgi:hypothetical protein
MHYYKAHGLSLKSEIEFPELIEGPKSHNILIKYRKIDYSTKKVLSKGVFRVASHYILTNDSVYLIWNDITICQIVEGNEIIVNTGTGIEINFLRALVLGPAMGILLHQRGRLVLHASSVNINDGAVAFMGHNGAGKSTTTVSFIASGHPLVSDDILSLEFREGIPMVFPGFPRIKLWPESKKMLNEKLESFPIHSESRKRSCKVNNFHDQIIPLKQVYVIENNDETYLETMSPQEALIELIRNSYCANIFQNSEQATNLGEYAKIVKNVNIKQLNIKKDLSKIPQMVDLVEKDVFNSYK